MHWLKLLSFIPLIGVNAWHGILTLQYNKFDRLDTLSEQAAKRPRLLHAHQLIHCTSSVLLILFACTYLWPHNHYLLFILLTSGALFDGIEVLTLHPHTPGNPIKFDAHVLSTWAMALLYMFYAISIGITAGMPQIAIHSIWTIFLAVLAIANRFKYKNFWIAQTAYFNYLMIFILVSTLLLK